MFGCILPAWLSKLGPVLIQNFTQSYKNDDLVCKVELTEA